MNTAYVAPIALLLLSNVFMTFAWYGQLKFPGASLWVVIPISWGIAFIEYCLAVPANRIGGGVKGRGGGVRPEAWRADGPRGCVRQ